MDFEHEGKNRKSVIALSVLLIVFSNLEFPTDELSFFNHQIVIHKSSLVSVLKLSLSIFLIAYLASLLENLPLRVHRHLRRRHQNWWAPIAEEIKWRDFDEATGGQVDQDMLQEKDEWRAKVNEEKLSRKNTRHLILGMYRPLATILRFLSRVAWPFFLGYVAIWHPELALIFSM